MIPHDFSVKQPKTGNGGPISQRPFPSYRVRHAVKVTIAALLAFYLAQLIRLESPSWSVLTVFVLSMAQYVGAIGEKSFYRIIGTIAGGLTGYLLTAGLEQQPVTYITSVALLTGLGTALYGQNRAPYAFYLFSLTLLIVCAEGMGVPGQSWNVALGRMEEVCLGVVVAMVVGLVLWPRSARDEFGRLVGDCRSQLARRLVGLMEEFLGSGRNGHRDTASGSVPLKKLRQLLHFGAYESRPFRKQLSEKTHLVTALTTIASRLDLIEHTRPSASIYRQLLGQPLRNHVRSIANVLECPHPSSCPAVDRSRTALSEALLALSQTGRPLHKVGQRSSRDLADWVLTLDEIAAEARDIVPGTAPPVVKKTRTKSPLFVMDHSWWITGLRSTLAVAAGLILMNWLHPPGGAMIVLAAYTFTARSRVMPGGEGDRRSFNLVVLFGLLGIPLTLVLLFLTPVLSSYAAFNILFGASVFLYGYLSYPLSGISLGMRLSYLLIVGVVNLNAQMPVDFQQVVGIYLGLLVGLVVSAVVRRLIAPVLPQHELRRFWREWIGHCESLTSTAPRSNGQRRLQRLALLPTECATWIQRLQPPEARPECHRAYKRATSYLNMLSISLAAPARPATENLPDPTLQHLNQTLTPLRQSTHAALSTCHRWLRSSSIGQNDHPGPEEQHLRMAVIHTLRSVPSLRRELLDSGIAPDQRYILIADLDRLLRRAMATWRLTCQMRFLPEDAFLDTRL